MFRSISLVIVALIGLPNAAGDDRPNVLFIAIDDLRPELGCYGRTHIHSPNIDQLAATGLLFQRAYCMVPTCGASRASLFTGLRPHRKRFVNYLARADKDAPQALPLHTHLQRNGYQTISIGKVLHVAGDSADGWSQPAWRPQAMSSYQDPRNQSIHERNAARYDKEQKLEASVQKIIRAQEKAGVPKQEQQKKFKADRWHSRGPAWESADVDDNAYRDGMIAKKAIAELRRLESATQPFFLAVGFLKPHLPFVAPQRYWKLYDRDQISLPDNYAIPANAPRESIHSSGELRSYEGIPKKGPVDEETAVNLIHGYYACVSYIDALIGEVLAELERLNLANSTMVVLWGDHGWNLGEHTLWCKHSCYETSMRIPLIIRVPGKSGNHQRSTPIETIDIYPTLCHLTGLPTPAHLQGHSFVNLLDDESPILQSQAIGRYGNGDTIRTDRYRYSEYRDRDGSIIARMLYDHLRDPDETRNVLKTQPEVVRRLSEQLNTAIPDSTE